MAVAQWELSSQVLFQPSPPGAEWSTAALYINSKLFKLTADAVAADAVAADAVAADAVTANAVTANAVTVYLCRSVMLSSADPRLWISADGDCDTWRGRAAA